MSTLECVATEQLGANPRGSVEESPRRDRKGPNDLRMFLDQLPPDTNDHELVELLIDMNRDDELAFRWDEFRGLPIRLWYPLSPDVYAHRTFTIERDVPSVLAELFLIRELEFSAQTAPAVSFHPIMPTKEKWIA